VGEGRRSSTMGIPIAAMVLLLLLGVCAVYVPLGICISCEGKGRITQQWVMDRECDTCKGLGRIPLRTWLRDR